MLWHTIFRLPTGEVFTYKESMATLEKK